MMSLTIFSQFLLYVSLALLMGTFILYCIPETIRPKIDISAKWLIVSAVILPIVTFVPNIQLLTILTPQFGFIESLGMLLLKFKVGHSWLAVVGFTIILLIMIRQFMKKPSKLISVMSIFILIAIMTAIGYISHAGSMTGIVGSALDFVHLLAVSVWLGILVLMSFFSKDAQNWDAFLKWFSPVALVAFTAVALTGVLMTDTIVPGYVTSWSSNYGQFLFIKHVLLVPLTVIILANSLLIKLKMDKPLFEPRTWVRIETVLLVMILFITALYSEQQPPSFYVQEISPFFEMFYRSSIEAGMRGYLQMTGIGLGFFLLTALFIALVIVSYIKQLPVVVSAAMTFALALCFYMGFMSIVFFK
ncbi:copper resistance D family protein [Solibacillus isronensis]|uniref:copper resistance D family protein n=1 Tax=Solibacillus isronensis TaxID=412383 RepID=UPI002040D666|nr:CopD family protein [Solibacillus isronensis]MCM3721266.1 CopD family protein [Solibacillus isronensis]